MNWSESIYLIKELKQLIAAQTTAISSEQGAHIFFTGDSTATAIKGDILFVIPTDENSSND